MRRFIETGEGKDSLGKSAEFRHARTVMPLARDDTVFVYLSDAFFRNMAGPHYWVEMRRRLEATADIELVEMASLASATEGKPGESIDELVSGGFLPPWFGPRPTAAPSVLDEDEVRDSLRGGRGHFVPIPDVPVERITPAEAEAYRKFLDFYHAKWGRLDPMIVGIKREGLPEHRERIVLDVHANPFAKRHVEMLSQWIGPADQQRLAPVPGDLMAMEVQLTNQRLFGGLRDFGLPFEMVDGRMVPAGGLMNVLVGYVGTTGSLGFLSLLDVGVAGPPDAEGYAGREPGLWRYQQGDFTVFSLQREVLGRGPPATAIRTGRASGAVPAPRRRRRLGAAHPGAEHARLPPHAGDFAGQPPPDARPGAATPRAGARLPRGRRVALGREADLPAGRNV